MRSILLRYLTFIALSIGLCLGQNPSVGHGPVDKPSAPATNKTITKRKIATRKTAAPAYDQLISQAQKQIDAKEFSSAIKVLEQAKSIAKNDVERHQAEDLLARAKTRQQIASLTKTAREAGKQGNHEAEIQTYEQVLAVDPSDEPTRKELIKALLGEGERFTTSGKTDGAIQDYDKAEKLLKDAEPNQAADIRDKTNKLIWHDADSEFKARRYSVTRQRYKQLIERSPDNHEAVNEVVEHCLSDARNLYQNGQYNEAQLFADDALAYSPGSGEALQLQKRSQAQLDRQRGERLLSEDKTVEAIKVLRSASQWLNDDQDLAREIAVAQARAEFAPAMIRLKGGRFRMGSDRGALDEQPEHTVDVSPFLISKYEITNAEYKQFCDDTHRDYPLNPAGWGSYFLEYPDHPVVNVTYNDAVSYCEWLSQKT